VFFPCGHLWKRSQTQIVTKIASCYEEVVQQSKCTSLRRTKKYAINYMLFSIKRIF
jgi:hypothetical protein